MTTVIMLAAIGLALLSALLIFVIALMAAPRGITSGPLVSIARGLFLITLGASAIAFAALVLGLSTRWA